ncbi:TonB-dependent receptor [Salibacteraceae bacterium]|nr:TonB-dependent receptor [Salibacteraceae bacterium]
MIRIIHTVLLLFSVFIVTAQKATIQGVVKDNYGNSVDAATVGVPGTTFGTTSSEDGSFRFEIPANQDLKVIVRHISFQEYSVFVNGKSSETIRINATVKDRANDIKTFTLTEERDREKPMRKIEAGMAKFNPSVTGSVESLLPAQALGVSTNNELSSQYSVRGGNFDENLVYVNGIQVYRPFLIRSGQQEGLSFINSDLVSSISFSSGGFESKYGDKLSSVLDITYKKPEKFAGSVSASLLGANIHIENASDNKRFTQIHGLRYFSNQYLLGSLDTDGSYRPRFIDYQTYLTYSFNSDWEVSFLGNYSQNQYQFAPRSREASFGTVSSAVGLNVFFEGQEVDQYQTAFGALALQWTPRYNFNLRLIASAFQTLEEETFDIEAAYSLSELETDLGSESFGDEAFTIGTGSYLNHARNYLDALVASLELQGEYTGDNHKWLWGLKYRRDDIIDKLNEWRLVDSVGYSVPYTGTDVNLFETIKSDNRIATNRVMGYLQRDWNFDLKNHKLFLSTGARFHYWDFNEQTTFSPRFLAAFTPDWNQDWIFRASWGYYHQPAFYREMRDLNGNVNPAIRAQKSIHYVLGADYNFTMLGRPFKFVGEAYYKQLSEIIPYELDNVRIRYYATNNAVGFAQGVDLKLNGEFVKGIESWISLSVMQTQEDILDDQYDEYTVQLDDTTFKSLKPFGTVLDTTTIYPGYIARPTDQRVNFAMTFQDYVPGLEQIKAHLSLIFGTGLPTGPPSYTRWQDVFRMPPYRRVDIGFSARLKDEAKESSSPVFKHINSAWITLEVFNLLAVNNTISYLWIKDASNTEYGVPNYLTNRRVNLKLIVKF